MGDFKLTYESEDGVEDIGLEGGRISFGRGSEADRRFADDGLSRLHATVYCEDGHIWVVDENSSNGTLVNGEPVSGSGTPLSDGDLLRIGHHTNLRVIEIAPVSSAPSSASQPGAGTSATSEPSGKSQLLLPLAVIGIAFLLILSSVAVIGITMFGNGDKEIASSTPDDELGPDEGSVNGDDPAPEGTNGSGNSDTMPSAEPSAHPTGTNGVPGGTGSPLPPSLPNKLYMQMTESEKNLYVKVKAEKVAMLIGNKASGDIPPDAVASIRRWVDQYARRFRSTRRDDCSGRGYTGSDMESVLARAAKNVPFITRSFRSQAVDPQVGIYVAMIESEHCVCLQSNTGPLGMFQFTQATGASFGLATRSGASPSNPDERCEPLPASLASAKYLKYLSGRIGTGPLSLPLAIASYNSGEGGLGKNLMTALTSNSSEERSFWTLVANAEKLSQQFKSENIKYVPKFFGAAIVGENPRDFGSQLQPLSSYTR